MRIIVSTISHHHTEMIIHLASLKKLAKADDIVVLCRDNAKSRELREYCLENNIIYLANHQPQGFARNNNLNFRYYLQNLAPQKDDFFLLLNPDIEITPNTIPELRMSLMTSEKELIVGNLFLERSWMVPDDNIRLYPRFRQFVRTYLFGDRSTMIDRRNQTLPKPGTYWASGAFLALRAGLYQDLGGLDERFYMYCEDIDFSRRALSMGLTIKLAENVKALHWRQRASKKLLSKFFFWHVMSVMKYCCLPRKGKCTAAKSALYEVQPTTPISVPSYPESAVSSAMTQDQLT
ncbi:Rhamnosyltransferase WbbL [Vibrio aerogenes CECT 7868]|uniref:Rhamnosyltransferase WbbL n=1 Tax=Vibrio aerogenes CECT 7868 TaxID=1216006 RepID=A0A1M5ZC65_9VIBR|nr:glycosyltransferase family 2 protein [Vibrio aerogenes]SHI21845.1 Rhamnosyltransferase WbbL [Vibrio aerogenes CECT 7868]